MESGEWRVKSGGQRRARVCAPLSQTRSSLLLSHLVLSDTKAMGLEYEPSSEPQHISVEELFLRSFPRNHALGRMREKDQERTREKR